MKRFHALLFLLLFCAVDAAAQLPRTKEMADAIRYFRKTKPFTGDHYTLTSSEASHCMLNDSVVVDRCRLRVTYSAKIMLDTIGQFRCNDLVVVELGDSLQKFYSLVWWRINMNHTLFEQGMGAKQTKGDKSMQAAIDYAVYRDLKQPKLTNRHMMYQMKNLRGIKPNV